ncbi:MAG: NblA/ycf18 family protein [Pleurocapsa minor HA4230-MV1]|jgi:hypothetical protein|nr:NblA/ycf18 family protein [Pleurocapsa minor HA4230-MV1]
MSENNTLTIEQEFHLRKIADQTKSLSQQQAQELIVELQRQMILKLGFCLIKLLIRRRKLIISTFQCL